MQGIYATRMNMLPKSVVCVGFRVGDVSPGSRAVVDTDSAGGQGDAGFTVGTANDAFLYGIRGTESNTFKRGFLHTAPDELVASGDFNTFTRCNFLARSWLNALASEGFLFRYKVTNNANTQGNILYIDETGNVNLETAIVGLTAQSVVQIVRCRDTDGKTIKGNWSLAAFTNGSTFKLRNWFTGHIVNLSGKVRLISYGYTGIVPLPSGNKPTNPLIRVGDRKVGRPFFQLRGRVTARR